LRHLRHRRNKLTKRVSGPHLRDHADQAPDALILAPPSNKGHKTWAIDELHEDVVVVLHGDVHWHSHGELF
jgi:hypothetical protein